MERLDGQIYIYALVDPVDDNVRYVGQSVDPDQRFLQHAQFAHPGVYKWIKTLRESGRDAIVKVLEIVDDGKALSAERKWILEYYGDRLLNGDCMPLEMIYHAHPQVGHDLINLASLKAGMATDAVLHDTDHRRRLDRMVCLLRARHRRAAQSLTARRRVGTAARHVDAGAPARRGKVKDDE